MSTSPIEAGIDLSKFAKPKDTEPDDEQTGETALNLERYIPVRNELDNLQELLTPPEDVNPYVKALIPKAATEVVDYLNAPLTAAGNTLQSEAIKNLHESVQRDYCEHSLKGAQALEFLNGLCAELHNLNGTPPEINIGFVREREQGGIRLQISAAETDGYLGVIRGIENEERAPSEASFGPSDEVIKAVEIVVRPGKRTGAQDAEESYTPMQLNFRFLDENRGEITSLRLDMHNRGESYTDVPTASGAIRRERIVQFDGQVGGKRTETSHRNMHSLNDEGSPQENFKLLQAVFFTNLVERTIRSGERGIKAGLDIPEADLNEIKDEYKKAKRYLTEFTPKV